MSSQPAGPIRVGESTLNRVQSWGFVLAGVAGLLTFPIVGIAFGLAAVALGCRTPTPYVRGAGAVVALLALVVVGFGLGGGRGGGLVD